MTIFGVPIYLEGFLNPDFGVGLWAIAFLGTLFCIAYEREVSRPSFLLVVLIWVFFVTWVVTYLAIKHGWSLIL